MIRVLFVCTGNICRSPSAAGVFQALVERQGLQVEVDSAGTHSFHIGAPPDQRAQHSAAARGFNISRSRARQVGQGDFEYFDYIVAMDDQNVSALQSLARGRTAPIHLLMKFAPSRGERHVPDPYFSGREGFEHVLDLIETAANGLLAYLRRRHDLQASAN